MEELHGISNKSCDILKSMGPQIQWLESFVTEDKLYCIYIAPNKEVILSHAEKGGFPADKISKIVTIIDPTAGE
jgi:hypothetical protein